MAVVLAVSGCATSPYRFGRFHPQEPDGVAPQSIVVQQGTPHKTLDRLGWVVGLPERLFTLNSKASNHKVSPETLEALQTYLEANDLTDVLVAVNDYDPKGQWQRLRQNDRIAPFWRYSVGSLSWLGYTLFPYRVFGGDEYNPFTNSLNMTSDVPALVLAEGAYAKDIHGSEIPGAYATMSRLPILSLMRQTRAASDVLGYARVQNDWPGEQEAYHVLYPHIGSMAFGPSPHLFPVVGPFMSVGGALVGHATGRTVATIQTPTLIEASPDGDPSDTNSVTAEKLFVRKSLLLRRQPDVLMPDGVVQAQAEGALPLNLDP